MKIKSIPSSWLREDEHRLDCGPFTSGSIETRKRLESLKFRKDKLAEVTKGGISGMYHVGQDKLQWVVDQNYGIRFLRSSDILLADFSNQPFIAKEQVKRNPLFQCPPGTTLITRSGTIGRMAYCRQEMAEMAISQDVLKVVPDTDKVLSGYLYAFLSSKFGVPMIIGGTFGSIIVHIEANNIADLPVPRLGEEIERQVHELVEKAAELRSTAAQKRKLAVDAVVKLLDWESRPLHSLSTVVSSRYLQRRMDGFHHTPAVQSARKLLASANNATRLGDLVEDVFEPNRGARRQIEDPNYGVPFLSSSQVFALDPVGEYLISKRLTPHFDRLLVLENDLWLPRSGQLGGIIGHAVLPLETCYGSAASEHLIRIRCKTKTDAYYLWAIFASEPGYYAAIGTAYGSSIPSLDCTLLENLYVPWFSEGIRNQISQTVYENIEALTDAVRCERNAVFLVEQAIEGAT